MTYPARESRQHGFTLIEALVALVIAALGVMGIVGVQIRTLSNTQNSVHRTQAIQLINDLGERIKALPVGIDAASGLEGQWDAPIAGNSPDCTSECSAADLAEYSLRQWLDNVMQNLPLAEARIFTTDDPGQLGVMLAWRSSSGDIDDDDGEQLGRDKTEICPNGEEADGKLCHLQYISLTRRCEPWGSTYHCAAD